MLVARRRITFTGDSAMTQPHSKDDVLRMADTLESRSVSMIGQMKAATMLRAYAEVVEGWRPIETAPTDGTVHIRGLYVRGPKSHGIKWNWHANIGYVNDNGDFADMDDTYTGWDAEDYEYWMPLSVAPPLPAALSTPDSQEIKP